MYGLVKMLQPAGLARIFIFYVQASHTNLCTMSAFRTQPANLRNLVQVGRHCQATAMCNLYRKTRRCSVVLRVGVGVSSSSLRPNPRRAVCDVRGCSVLERKLLCLGAWIVIRCSITGNAHVAGITRIRRWEPQHRTSPLSAYHPQQQEPVRTFVPCKHRCCTVDLCQSVITRPQEQQDRAQGGRR